MIKRAESSCCENDRLYDTDHNNLILLIWNEEMDAIIHALKLISGPSASSHPLLLSLSECSYPLVLPKQKWECNIRQWRGPYSWGAWDCVRWSCQQWWGIVVVPTFLIWWMPSQFYQSPLHSLLTRGVQWHRWRPSPGPSQQPGSAVRAQSALQTGTAQLRFLW